MTDGYVVGTGMVGAQQLTRDALTVLRRSSVVYVLHPQDVFKEYLANEFDAEIKSLSAVYRSGRERSEIYDDVATTFVNSARSAEEPVSLALYGHPMVGVSPSAMIRDRVVDTKTTIEFVAGISSLDCLFVELGIDPLDGLQLFDVTELLGSGRDLNRNVPTILFQVGSIGNLTHNTATDEITDGLSRLDNYLLDQYPSEHKMTLARVATYPFATSDLLEISVGELVSVADTITKMHSLYIPATEGTPRE